MEVSGAAPDWALVRELAPLLCCRMAWTTQIGQRLGPFRGGQGLAGGCDCVPDAMPMQCTMHCQLIWPPATGRRTKRAPPSQSLFLGPFLGLDGLRPAGFESLGFPVSIHGCMLCMYVFIRMQQQQQRRREEKRVDSSYIFRFLSTVQTTSTY